MTQTQEASGIRFLGTTDPKKLSQEDFDKSPDLLFHPARQAFAFSQHQDSNIPEYFLEGNTSETLGEGFYTTPDRKEAEARSRARQGTPTTLPILIPLLPFQARMMDFRDRGDPRLNGAVPTSMTKRWFQYFVDYFHSEKRADLPWVVTQPEERYYLYLREVIALPHLDLRVMLGTTPFPQSPNLANPPWSKLFANFIIREGMDGVIYNEPSISNPKQLTPICVFYTLTKIGTFEAWHTSQTPQAQRPS